MGGGGSGATWRGVAFLDSLGWLVGDAGKVSALDSARVHRLQPHIPAATRLILKCGIVQVNLQLSARRFPLYGQLILHHLGFAQGGVMRRLGFMCNC